jgi:hypothetical protein
MTVRTYNPGNIIAVFGSIPVLEWNSIRVHKAPFGGIIKGKNGEICRVKFKNGDVVTVELTIPHSSYYNTTLSVLKELDLPIAIHLLEIREVDFRAVNKVANITANAAILAAIGNITGSQAFIWPASFIDTDGNSWDKKSGDVVWKFQGILKGEIIGGYLD